MWAAKSFELNKISLERVKLDVDAHHHKTSVSVANVCGLRNLRGCIEGLRWDRIESLRFCLISVVEEANEVIPQIDIWYRPKTSTKHLWQLLFTERGRIRRSTEGTLTAATAAVRSLFLCAELTVKFGRSKSPNICSRRAAVTRWCRLTVVLDKLSHF